MLMNNKNHFAAFIISLTTVCVVQAADPLVAIQKMTADAMAASTARMRVTAENMANAQSSNYVPKSIHLRSKRKLGKNYNSIEVAKIKQEHDKTRQEYNPTHPDANTQGYVTMPDINPMIEMVNMQQTKADIERSLNIYKTTTDLRYKMIGMTQVR